MRLINADIAYLYLNNTACKQLETRIYANPMANCCFDMGKAIKTITEKWNRRDGS